MATLEELTTRRAAYLAAELRILDSQEYQVGAGGNARRNRRAELENIQAGIRELDTQIASLQGATQRRVHYIVPSCR